MVVNFIRSAPPVCPYPLSLLSLHLFAISKNIVAAVGYKGHFLPLPKQQNKMRMWKVYQELASDGDEQGALVKRLKVLGGDSVLNFLERKALINRIGVVGGRKQKGHFVTSYVPLRMKVKENFFANTRTHKTPVQLTTNFSAISSAPPNSCPSHVKREVGL